MQGSSEMVGAPALRLPMQSAPVNRDPIAAAAYSSAHGIEPSGWFDDIVGGIQSAIGVAQQAAPIATQLGSMFGI